MVKSARHAEKNLGYITSNGVRRNDKSLSPDEIGREIKVLIFNIKNKKLDQDKLKSCRKRLRQLQRVNIHIKFRNKSIQLDKLLKLDKNNFWKKIAAFKRSARKRAIIDSYQPSLRDFSKYYKNLFSHSDRVSKSEHLVVEECVRKHFEKIKDIKYKIDFSTAFLKQCIDKLKINKSPGFDFISNEFFKFGNSDALVLILKKLFELMLSIGYVPVNFNTSIIKPIPKKNNIASLVDYRPISISLVICSILESCLLSKMKVLESMHRNQFGYKCATSCKSAYYVVNEVASLYRFGKSKLHLISLDATKAFDKLWREGLFFKLIEKVDDGLWRLLFNYYKGSKSVVNIGGMNSDSFETSQDVMQGGVLWPFLFKFFMNDLLE